MQGSRKSHIGSLGLKPVRLDTLSCLAGSRVSPNAVHLGATRTPHMGSSKRVKPIREGDVKELSVLYSSIKKSINKKQGHANNCRAKTPNSRRCLYDDLNNQTPGIKKISSAKGKPGRSGQEASKKAETSKIPRVSISRPMSTVSKRPSKLNLPVPSNVSKGLPVKRNGPVSSRPSVSLLPQPGPSTHAHIVQQDLLCQIKCLVEEQKKTLKETQSTMAMQRKMLEEANFVIEQQKNMLEEAKAAFSSLLCDQRCTLNDMQSILSEQKKMLAEDTEHEFTKLEKQFNSRLSLAGSQTLPFQSTRSSQIKPVDKENSSPKSAAAYRDMRKSFGCLHTPIISSKKSRISKPKTPRSLLLSAKVKAQLEELLDE